MCLPTLKQYRAELVAAGKITQAESDRLRDDALIIGFTMGIVGLIGGFGAGYLIALGV